MDEVKLLRAEARHAKQEEVPRRSRGLSWESSPLSSRDRVVIGIISTSWFKRRTALVADRSAPDTGGRAADETGLGGGPHIALLTRGLRGGGVQVLMMNMARELAARGLAVDLVCRARRAKGQAPAGINVQTLADYPRVVGRILAWRADRTSR